jgi:hypothetical protein
MRYDASEATVTENPYRDHLIPRAADGSYHPWWWYCLLYGFVLLVVLWLSGIVLSAFAA